MIERAEIKRIVRDSIDTSVNSRVCTHLDHPSKFKIGVIMKESDGREGGCRKTTVGARELLVLIFVERISDEIRYKLRMIAGDIFARNFDVNSLGTYLLRRCKENLVVDEREAVRELVLSIANSV